MSEVSQVRTVTIKEAIPAIKKCVQVKRPLMVWGQPGIGKSDVIAQLCSEMNGKLYDVRLPLLEPTDLRGIPFYNRDTGKMDWAAPVDLPDDNDASQYPVTFLFLDELNGAAPAVQAAAYQLILNRKIGQYTLPSNCVVIAAGNREADKGVTYRMPSPLANRFVHLEIRVDFDSWQEWALNNRIHKDVVGYLNFSKDSLSQFDPRSPSRSFATPRSWQFVSQLIADDDVETHTLTDLVSGAIGEGVALKFMAHRLIASKLPVPTDILLGKVTELKTKEIGAMYSLVTSMCYELRDYADKNKHMDKFHGLVDNFFAFLMANMPAEIAVMGCRAALKTFALPIKSKELKTYDEFYNRYGKLVLASS